MCVCVCVGSELATLSSDAQVITLATFHVHKLAGDVETPTEKRLPKQWDEQMSSNSPVSNTQTRRLFGEELGRKGDEFVSLS